MFIREDDKDSKKIIEIEKLNKHFGDVHAVRDLSFYVNEGEFFSFLGLNGAGKSTTISIMCGIYKKDSGKVRIGSDDLDSNGRNSKRELGVVFQSSVLDPVLTVRENLEIRAAFYGITGAEFEKRLDYLSSLLEFGELYKRRVGKLSGGQRRRIDIARALVHDPKILILDEPTTGLDPQTRKLLWESVDTLRKEKKLTVFLTTHYMEEAADSDYIVILDAGQIAAQGTVNELKNKYAGDYLNLYGVEKSAVESLDCEYETINDGYRLKLKSTSDATKLILSQPQLFNDYEVIKGKMDDVFLAATGKRLTEEKRS